MFFDFIQLIQFVLGLVDRVVMEVVKVLFFDVDRIFLKGKIWNVFSNEFYLIDMNQFGEMVFIDEVMGDIIGGEMYYGWLCQFCEKMREW